MFDEKYIFEHEKGDKYNIICDHARFNKERMLNVMKEGKTKIVTIIRDPLNHFESTAVYFNFERLFGMRKIMNKSENILEAFFKLSEVGKPAVVYGF